MGKTASPSAHSGLASVRGSARNQPSNAKETEEDTNDPEEQRSGAKGHFGFPNAPDHVEQGKEEKEMEEEATRKERLPIKIPRPA